MVQSEQPDRQGQGQPELEPSLGGIAGGSRQIPVLAEPQAHQGEPDIPAHHSRSPPTEEGRKSSLDERRRALTARFAKQQQERKRDRGSRSR